MLLEQAPELGGGIAVRQACPERPDPRVLRRSTDERLRQRSGPLGEKREDELLLVAEVAADLAREDAPELLRDRRQLLLAGVRGRAAKLPRADEGVVMVVRERHERWMASHPADGMRPRKLGA